MSVALLLEAEEVWTADVLLIGAKLLLGAKGGLLDVGDLWLTTDVLLEAALLGTKHVLLEAALLGTKDVLLGAALLGTKDVLLEAALLGTKDVLLGAALLGTKDVLLEAALLGTKDVLLGAALMGTKDVLLEAALLGTKDVLLGAALLGTKDVLLGAALLGTKDVLLGAAIKGVLLGAEGRLLAEVIGAKRVLDMLLIGASEALLTAECIALLSDEDVFLDATVDNTFEEVLKIEGLLLEGKDALPGPEVLVFSILLVLLGLPWVEGAMAG